MSKWKKRFSAWQTAKQPISVDEVEALLFKVFGNRVREHHGTSHRWTVDVPELVNANDDFCFGRIGFPVSGGKVVKAKYCQIGYQAAQLLGLLENEENEPNEDD